MTLFLQRDGLRFSFSAGVVLLWAWPKESYCVLCFGSLNRMIIDSNHTTACIWNKFNGRASLLLSLFSSISFLWDASTSLVFQEKTGPCPSFWLLLSFSWQTEPKVSIEEAGRDTTHSEFMKDLTYHQSEGFQILPLCFLMILSLWWGIKDCSQGYRRQGEVCGRRHYTVSWSCSLIINDAADWAETINILIISTWALLREIWICTLKWIFSC